MKHLIYFICAVVTALPQCAAGDLNWTVVTLARDGSLGVASSNSQPKAIADSIKACRAMADTSNDCGAQFIAAKGSWIIANLCGDHTLMATGNSLVEAEQEALYREISLQFYVPDLSPCKRVVLVDPIGALVRSKQNLFTAR